MRLRKIFTFPARNLVCVIPAVIFAALVSGRFVDTSPMKDMILLLNVELRNLPIAIGIAVTAFTPQTAMIAALAFLFQQQFVIWFWKLDNRFKLLGP